MAWNAPAAPVADEEYTYNGVTYVWVVHANNEGAWKIKAGRSPVINAGLVDYDNSQSGLAADNVQDAIDENTINISQNASDIDQNASDIAALQSIRYSKLDNPLCHLFKKNKLVDTLAGYLTWTNAGGSTYVDQYGALQYSPSPVATNLLTWSEDFSNTTWYKASAVSVIGNSAISPNGELSANKIIATDGVAGNNNRWSQNITVSDTADKSYTFSIWAKGSDGGELLRFLLRNTTAVETIDQTFELSSKWERYSVTLTCLLSDTVLSITIGQQSIIQTYYVWGAQIEQSNVANGYIKTEATSQSGTSYVGIDQSRQEVDGWLIERTSTNLCLYSSNFTSGGWGVSNASREWESSETAPDGTLGVTKLVESATYAEHFIQQNVITSSTANTISWFVKRADGVRNFRFRVGDTIAGFIGQIHFDFDTESFYNASADIAGEVKKLDDGWYRLSATSESFAAGGSLSVRAQLVQVDSNSASYTGDGSSSLYIWGAQLEELPFATSYIPTTDAAATRAGDDVGITCRGNLPGLESFSIVTFTKTPIDSEAALVLYADALSPDASYSVIPTVSNPFASSYHKGGQITPNVASEIDGEITVTVISYDFDTGELTRVYGGISSTQIRELTGDAQPNGLSMGVGCDQNGGNQINGHIKDFRIYDFALNEAEVKFLAGE